MSDLFHEGVPDNYIDAVVDVMLRTPRHIFRVLTKRSRRMAELLSTRLRFAAGKEIVDIETFKRVQDVTSGRNRGNRSRKHRFPFVGLLRCRHDGCCVSAEIHKGKYVYYRCSFGRGPCDLPYMPQPKLSAALGVLLQNLQIPEERTPIPLR
jgi:phage protein Gp37/Gp68